MSILINEIKMPLNHSLFEVFEKAAKILNISENQGDFSVYKQSIDARRKNNILIVYSVLVDNLKNEQAFLNKNSNVLQINLKNNEKIIFGKEKLEKRPIIVGTGPAGLFCGYLLAKNGYRPILLERGDAVDERAKKVNSFWNGGRLDLNTNIQFGEGGAGTFSDGKLTTRINDPKCREVFEIFASFGAPKEILYKSKPHIGTDYLKITVKNMRNEIIKLGGEVLFKSCVTDIFIKNNKISGLKINDSLDLEADVTVLAIGHSARDTYEMLYKRGVEITKKPFSVGVRIEHLQEDISYSQYGDFYKHPLLFAADYQLVYKNKNRACYSFCMCPGGTVVASASEEETIVTNGMSEFARDLKNANSALCVPVMPTDLEGNSPLSGMYFQRELEKMAYKIGGNNNNAPISLVSDFLNDKVSSKIGRVKPSYTGNYSFADLSKCLPFFVTNTLKEALPYFDTKIKGFASSDAVLTGVETRTTSPVRIVRNDQKTSNDIINLYPCGEGAGYSGGIVSSAVDGINTANSIMKKYSPF